MLIGARLEESLAMWMTAFCLPLLGEFNARPFSNSSTNMAISNAKSFAGI